jgi:hypothetical protein
MSSYTIIRWLIQNVCSFWDVKQFVLPIRVGGPTKSARFLKEFLLYQMELENCIPKVNIEAIEYEGQETDL